VKIVNTINANLSNISPPIRKVLIPEYKLLNQPIKPMATPSRHERIRTIKFASLPLLLTAKSPT
jgi:hypothetical protein